MKFTCSRRSFSDRRGGALFKLIAFLFLFGGVLTAAWIFFLPPLLTSVLSKRTGFGVKVTQLALNPFTSRVDLEGLLVSNPSTYPRTEFVEVRSFHADAILSSLLSDRPVLTYAKIDVAHIALIKSTDGTTNRDLFQDRLFGPKEKPDDDEVKNASGKPAPKKPVRDKDAPIATAPAKQFLIRRLELKIDKLILADYSGRKVTSKEVNLGFEHTYENVTDAKQLLTPIGVKGLSSVGAAISGLIPGDLGKVMGAATKSGESLKEPAKKAGESIRSMIDALEQTPKP